MPSIYEIIKLKNIAIKLNIRIPILISSDFFESSGCKKPATIINTITDKNHQKRLGLELDDCLIITNTSTPANLFISILGSVKGGSLMFINYLGEIKDNLFYRYLFQQLANIKIKAINNDMNKYSDIKLDNNLALHITTNFSQRHIIGKRGRGKSTLLGLISESLLKENKKILFTAPSKESARNSLKNIPNVSRETFRFCPPENIHFHVNDYDVIIVDEAASLSKNVIQSIPNNKQMLFATTIDGYESTGQNYRLNLKESDDVIELTFPFRFSKYDPIEKICNTMIWDNSDDEINVNHESGTFIYSNQELIEQQLTIPCYNLLKDAHYKTSPNDLMNFFNEDNIFVLTIQNNTISSCLIAIHEEIGAKINPVEIFYNLRRPKGALSLQSLITSYGILNIAKHRYLRVSRIATNKNYRRKNYATDLVSTLINYSEENKYDAVTSSFSATAESIAFWEFQQFSPIRIGLNKNKWNDCFALTFIYSINNCIEIEKMRSRFYLFWKFYNNRLYQQIFLKSISITEKNISFQKTPLIEEINSTLNGNRDFLLTLPLISHFHPYFLTFLGKNELKTIERLAESSIDVIRAQKSSFLSVFISIRENLANNIDYEIK